MNNPNEKSQAQRTDATTAIQARNENPFDPAFDPDLSTNALKHADRGLNTGENSGCHCGITRRQALTLAASLAALPVAAAATPFVPCEQPTQKITPCRHKFCRHYRSSGDYHQR